MSLGEIERMELDSASTATQEDLRRLHNVIETQRGPRGAVGSPADILALDVLLSCGRRIAVDPTQEEDQMV